MRDLPAMLPRIRIAASVPLEEIMARVREAANWTEDAPRPPTLASVNSGMRLAYAVDGTGADPYAGFEARIVPENITLLPKTTNQATGGNAWTERTVMVKKGDRKSTRLNSSHIQKSRMPSSA